MRPHPVVEVPVVVELGLQREPGSDLFAQEINPDGISGNEPAWKRGGPGEECLTFGLRRCARLAHKRDAAARSRGLMGPAGGLLAQRIGFEPRAHPGALRPPEVEVGEEHRRRLEAAGSARDHDLGLVVTDLDRDAAAL